MSILAALGLEAGTKDVPVPGGGAITVPAPYKPVLPGDYRHVDVECVFAYRKYHSTMAGTNECNGMIAVGRLSNFKDLKDFKLNARAGLTTRWSYANESEGRWYGRPEKYPEIGGEGANGPELVGTLKVHMVGWTVYDAPGCLYVVMDKRGIGIAVWIFNKDGGEKCARRYAERIAASFKP